MFNVEICLEHVVDCMQIFLSMMGWELNSSAYHIDVLTTGLQRDSSPVCTVYDTNFSCTARFSNAKKRRLLNSTFVNKQCKFNTTIQYSTV